MFYSRRTVFDPAPQGEGGQIGVPRPAVANGAIKCPEFLATKPAQPALQQNNNLGVAGRLFGGVPVGVPGQTRQVLGFHRNFLGILGSVSREDQTMFSFQYNIQYQVARQQPQGGQQPQPQLQPQPTPQPTPQPPQPPQQLQPPPIYNGFQGPGVLGNAGKWILDGSDLCLRINHSHPNIHRRRRLQHLPPAPRWCQLTHSLKAHLRPHQQMIMMMARQHQGRRRPWLP